MQTNFHRPEPILSHQARPADRGMSPRRAAERLCEGQTLIVSDSYHTGAEILAQLEQLLPEPEEGAHYERRREHRRHYRATAMRLLAPIKNYRLALAHQRPIGFLQELYFGMDAFTLPFIEVQELFGAWKRYQEGTHLAVLGHRLHPFFGTYVPTRTSHLELFGTWLSQYQGSKRYAVDVGTGCGVLALMLCRRGFERVLATDANPNAIESVSRDLARLNPCPPITLEHATFLGTAQEAAELIVFNPPWLKGEVEGLLDQALYYEDGLFESFFDHALEALEPDGRVVLLFSNVIGLVQPEVPHPIERELERGRFALIQKLSRKVKPPVDESGRRRRTREKVEVWELAKVP